MKTEPIRPITEERAHHKMLVAIDGPEFAHCGSLVKASVANYWSNLSIRMLGNSLRDLKILSHFISKPIYKLTKQSPDLSVMVKQI